MTTINYFWRLYTTFGGHILLSGSIYYFRWPCTTFYSYILLLMAIYHIRRWYITFDGYIPMNTSSWICHEFDVEIPRGRLEEITLILKGKWMWKLWHRFDVDISTWIRLSKSTKYRWVLHVNFSMLFRRQIDITSVLTVSILSFSSIFWSGNLFWTILIKCWVAAISMILT